MRAAAAVAEAAQGDAGQRATAMAMATGVLDPRPARPASAPPRPRTRPGRRPRGADRHVDPLGSGIALEEPLDVLDVGAGAGEGGVG